MIRKFSTANSHHHYLLNQVWQSQGNCGFLWLFIKETIFVIKLNGITTLCAFEWQKSFVVFPGKIKPSLVSMKKPVLKLNPSIECSEHVVNVVLFYVGKLAAKHTLVSVNSDQIYNFLHLWKTRKFPFVARPNQAKFNAHIKRSLKVTASKRMFTILLYTGKVSH